MMNNAVVFDTETTDLIHNKTLRLARQPYVIEFYAEEIDLDTGEVKQEFEALFRPPFALHKDTIKLTGITDEMLVDKGAFDLAAIRFLESADLLIAHNLSFDKDMIEVEALRLGHNMKWPFGLCTVEQTIGIKGTRLKLEQLYKELFNETFKAHRARNDVKALSRCAVELRKREMI
jgi:DNA polymerase III alpha subunit (gram-positive type)